MEKAVADHKKGNLQEAKQNYQEVLRAEPRHVHANHNLGLILAGEHQANDALAFFLLALEENRNVEQFWLSYIETLILLNDLEKAIEAIKSAKAVGFSGVNFDNLLKRTLNPSQLYAKGELFKASDGHYLNFLKALHKNIYEGYFEIGTRTGASLALSNSPSVSIDPFFQLDTNPVGNKDFCLMFQETSDSFFENRLSFLSGLKCQLAFIDGMHLFEYALRDFINLAKISSEKSLFLFHDPIPWTFEMTTRNYKDLPRGAAWTGDIWKLVHIFIDVGMKDNVKLLSSDPSGLLAVLNPDKKFVYMLENNYDQICSEWLDVNLNGDNIERFYKTGVFTKPELYLQYLRKISFGKKAENQSRDWVSH
jgi:tetratricopeptide (TPR) repeat protein